jgi:hypothetical protein
MNLFARTGQCLEVCLIQTQCFLQYLCTCLWKYICLVAYKIPKELWLSYEALIEGYVDEYKVYHNYQHPAWYWYPYFYIASVFYMLQTTRTLIDDKLREHYRDKTCAETVKIINAEKIEVTYEWKKRLYHMRLPVKRMELTEFIKASVVNDFTEEENWIIEGESINVTQYVKTLLGPCEDWHNIPYTPSFLGLPNLKIYKMHADEFEIHHQFFEIDDILTPLKNWSVRYKI